MQKESETDERLPEGIEQLGAGTRFREELCKMLERVPVFADFSRPEIEVIAQHTQAWRAREKTVLLPEGRRTNYLWILVEGRLQIFKEADMESPPRMMTDIRPGKMVGEMSLIDGMPHSATVIAQTECTLILLTRRHLEQINDDHPRTGLKILKRIAETISLRLRRTSGKLVDFIS